MIPYNNKTMCLVQIIRATKRKAKKAQKYQDIKSNKINRNAC